MFRKLFKYSVFIVFFLSITAHGNAGISNNNIDLIFSGLPPGGDSYYTAKISCGEIDGLAGEELLITDDYGSFVILGWDSETQTFQSKWLSDPIFTSYKIKASYIVSQPDTYTSYLIFNDTSNNLKIFRWVNYLVRDDTFIELKNLPTPKDKPVFTLGDFTKEHKGWEIESISEHTLGYSRFKIPFILLNMGYIKQSYRPIASYFLPDNYKNISMHRVHGMKGEIDGTVISSAIERGDKNTYLITYIMPGLKTCNNYVFDFEKRERIGWIGKLKDKSPVFLTTYQRGETEGKMSFYALGNKMRKVYDFDIPTGISSWIFGDLDADGVREMILLDFMGNLHVFNIENILKG